MPVTLTVADYIAEELVDRLETLINGTEQTDVVEVVRATRLGTFTPQDLQIVVMQSNPEIVPELMIPGNPPAEAWSLTFNLYLHMMPSETDSEVIDQKRNRFSADVRKVICTPTATWHNFDGYSIDANFGTLENIESGEGCGGIMMPLTVIFRTNEGDPYTVRA
tara:strand:+ start:1137 stop:1628 length:492 start_codon:yes stop_codon:yes gene_type:complete